MQSSRQSSTKTGNPLPESSNEFLAHYANDLRQKKVVATTRVQQETLARRQPQRPNAGTETPDIPAISKRSLTAADSQINRKALLSRQLDFDNVEEADSVATSAAGRLPANPAQIPGGRKPEQVDDHFYDSLDEEIPAPTAVSESIPDSMEEPVVTSNDDLSQPSTIANRESVVHDKNPTEPQSVDEQHFAGDAEPTVVTPMPRETSANVEDLRETASTQRIKVREYFDPRQVINDDPSLSGSRRSAKLDVGPTIHPMEPLPSESTAQAPLPLNSDNELTPERPISTRVSRNRQSFARVKIDQQDELHAPVKDEEFPWLEKSDEEFPAKNVLELKRRLQSAASLQPGDIPAGQSQSRDESSTRRPEDDDDAPLQSNRSQATSIPGHS